ncbi:MAG: hypothetical protein OXU20_28585 [Myxococcales bacterium]|nr:hypothetical protein [Myxococcales bacterium]
MSLSETPRVVVPSPWLALSVDGPLGAPLDPRTWVLAVPGGALFRVEVPGNPVVFVPNVTLDSLGSADLARR